MKKYVSVIILLLASASVFGQIDSLQTVVKKRHLLDSLSGLADFRLAMDSLTATSWGDSLRNKIGQKFQADSLYNRNKIDSLQSLGLPTNAYTQKLDSVVQKRDAMIAEVNKKQGELINKSKTKVEEWKSKVAAKFGVSKLPDTPKIPGGELLPNVNLPQGDLPKPPGMDLPNTGLPDLDIPEVPGLSMEDFNSKGLTPELGKINESLPFDDLDGLKDIQLKMGEAGSALKDVSALTKDSDKVLESSVGKLDEVGALKGELGKGVQDNELTKTAEMMKDPAAMQDQVKEQVYEKAVDHFAGKEEVLQQAMEKIAKYKQKYESINSLSDIKKRPPNPMKGKPFIERLVPGVALQLMTRNDLILDINPYVGYRISGRLSSGLGWNQRIGYDTKNNYFTSAAVIYGPRLFAECKIWKGFTGRIETEWMNTVVPPKVGVPITDKSGREWVNSTMVGLKKEYRFIKNVKGTAFIMFNLFNPEHKSPYSDVVNTRFGFEFPMKKKVKATS